jgi:serine/threonine-protein kinase
MSTDLNPRAMRIFDQVADLPAAQRAARLDELCAGDAGLRALVDSMLAADAQPDEPFSGNSARWSESLRTAAMPGAIAATGKTIGPWRIVGELGRGGMGAVYAVRRNDGAYDQQAALKLIRSAADSPAARERFLRERQLLAQLRHPHIATLLDGGFSDEGDPYFVMEYVDGLPIDAYCDAHRLSVRERIELFAQVLAAAGYAHRNLVVHRDLKPSNLLVDAQGQVKLLDFGIAKQLEDADATATSDRALTLEYASPEQLHAAPITTATDIWQLGIVLHRLLSGSHPFGLGRDTPLPKQLQLLEREPEPLTRAAAQAGTETAGLRNGLSPQALAKELRGNLSQIVAGCLQRVPEARYPSVEALAGDLRRWREHRPLRIAPAGRWTRTKLWLRRNRVAAGATAAVIVAVLAGTGTALWQAHEARAQARIAQRESANARAAMQFLTSTLAAAAPEKALNTEVSVRQLLDHARAELDKPGAVDPQVKQPVQRMLARMYASLDEPVIASGLFEAGLRGVEPSRRDEALAMAEDLVLWSDTHESLENYPQALETADRAVALRKRFAPDDPEQQVRALAHQTLAHVQKYGLDACEKQAEQALALARQLPEPPVDVVLDLYGDLGFTADARGNYERELSTSSEGLAFADAHRVAADSPVRAKLTRFKVEALIGLNRPDEAEAVIRQGIASVEKTGGAGGTRLGVLYSTLAIALDRQGRYRESLEAVETVQRLMPVASTGARNTGMTLSNQAFFTARLGNYPQALSLSEKAIAAVQGSDVPADDPWRRDIEMLHARIMANNGKPMQALPQLRELRERAVRIDGKDSTQYITLTAALANAMRLAGDAGQASSLLDEARAALIRSKAPANDPRFSGLLSEEAKLARVRGDMDAAEALQRTALRQHAGNQNKTDIAIAQADLAGILASRGKPEEARQLLRLSLPTLRNAVLPQESSRAAAEKLARQLGV